MVVESRTVVPVLSGLWSTSRILAVYCQVAHVGWCAGCIPLYGR